MSPRKRGNNNDSATQVSADKKTNPKPKPKTTKDLMHDMISLLKDSTKASKENFKKLGSTVEIICQKIGDDQIVAPVLEDFSFGYSEEDNTEDELGNPADLEVSEENGTDSEMEVVETTQARTRVKSRPKHQAGNKHSSRTRRNTYPQQDDELKVTDDEEFSDEEVFQRRVENVYVKLRNEELKASREVKIFGLFPDTGKDSVKTKIRNKELAAKRLSEVYSRITAAEIQYAFRVGKFVSGKERPMIVGLDCPKLVQKILDEKNKADSDIQRSVPRAQRRHDFELKASTDRKNARRPAHSEEVMIVVGRPGETRLKKVPTSHPKWKRLKEKQKEQKLASKKAKRPLSPSSPIYGSGKRQKMKNRRERSTSD